jgi:DNA-damage-inducible protein D
MKNKLGVPDNRPLADFLPTITIKAKDFANEITVFKTKEEDLNSEPEITREHIKNNLDVRNLLLNRNIAPENLPPSEDVKKVERRLESEKKKLPKSTKSLPKEKGGRA